MSKTLKGYGLMYAGKLDFGTIRELRRDAVATMHQRVPFQEFWRHNFSKASVARANNIKIVKLRIEVNDV